MPNILVQPRGEATIDRNRLMSHMQYRLVNFTAEASELRWAPGFWPETVHCPGVGNGLPFRPAEVVRMDSGEFGGIRYKQSCGCVNITVFND